MPRALVPVAGPCWGWVRYKVEFGKGDRAILRERATGRPIEADTRAHMSMLCGVFLVLTSRNGQHQHFYDIETRETTPVPHAGEVRTFLNKTAPVAIVVGSESSCLAFTARSPLRVVNLPQLPHWRLCSAREDYAVVSEGYTETRGELYHLVLPDGTVRPIEPPKDGSLEEDCTGQIYIRSGDTVRVFDPVAPGAAGPAARLPPPSGAKRATTPPADLRAVDLFLRGVPTRGFGDLLSSGVSGPLRVYYFEHMLVVTDDRLPRPLYLPIHSEPSRFPAVQAWGGKWVGLDDGRIFRVPAWGDPRARRLAALAGALGLRETSQRIYECF